MYNKLRENICNTRDQILTALTCKEFSKLVREKNPKNLTEKWIKETFGLGLCSPKMTETQLQGPNKMRTFLLSHEKSESSPVQVQWLHRASEAETLVGNLQWVALFFMATGQPFHLQAPHLRQTAAAKRHLLETLPFDLPAAK